MHSIIIIEKNGDVKSVNIKSYVEDELYKKAGFKQADGFKCFVTWPVTMKTNKINVSVYGKTTGRANQENKYEFPPPIDKILFFGNCVLVAKDLSGKIVSMSPDEWNTIYEILYGGFEDIGDEDTESEDDDIDEDGFEIKKTKTGYEKDDFVVDDDEDFDDEDEDDEEDELDDEEEAPPVIVKKAAVKRKYAKKAKKEPELIVENIENQDTLYECTSELSEESYIE